MASGKLAFVPEPLYDYIQYHDSVIGSCDFTTKPLSTRLGNELLSQGNEQGASFTKWQRVYQNDCLRLQFIASTLKIRLPEQSGNFTLNLMNGGVWSACKLAIVYLKNRLMRRTTNGAELGLMMGFLRGNDNKDPNKS